VLILSRISFVLILSLHAATDADTRRKLSKEVDEIMGVVGDVFASSAHVFKTVPFSVASEVGEPRTPCVCLHLARLLSCLLTRVCCGSF
jgi:hypothetical protein